MKIYKCDSCGDKFNPKDGMIDGWFTHERKIQLYDDNAWAKHGLGKKTYKVRKTLKLYKETATTSMMPSATIEVKKDLCSKCVKLLEKP